MAALIYRWGADLDRFEEQPYSWTPAELKVTRFHLQKIAETYEFSTEALYACMKLVAREYWNWWYFHLPIVRTGHGSPRSLEKLLKALKDVRKDDSPALRNRLTIGALAIDDAREAILQRRVLDERHPQPFAGLDDLIAQLESACFDGRQGKADLRMDLRSGAIPLRLLWAEDFPEDLTYWGDERKNLNSFLFDCLSLVDRSVTRRLVAEFDEPLLGVAKTLGGRWLHNIGEKYRRDGSDSSAPPRPSLLLAGNAPLR